MSLMKAGMWFASYEDLLKLMKKVDDTTYLRRKKTETVLSYNQNAKNKIEDKWQFKRVQYVHGVRILPQTRPLPLPQLPVE